MDVNLIRRLIERKGVNCIDTKEFKLKNLSPFLKNIEIKTYIESCLTSEGFTASEMSIKDLNTIQDEIAEGVAPGGFIAPFGYLVIATSIGGNAICFDKNSPNVYWADHSYFFDEIISYKNRETGTWIDLPINQENIRNALVLLDDNIQGFLIELFEDKLVEKLSLLD